jgi:hypothetical protein
MACHARASGEVGTPVSAENDHETGSRSPARVLWAMLLARLYELFPLLCPSCGAPMRIIAFITDTPAIRQIPDHIGEPSTPPPPAALPDGTDRRRPRRIRTGDSLRSIRSPITTTIKAFHGDRRFLRSQTVTASAALVTVGVPDFSLDRHISPRIAPMYDGRFHLLEVISIAAKGLGAPAGRADTSPQAVGFPSHYFATGGWIS